MHSQSAQEDEENKRSWFDKLLGRKSGGSTALRDVVEDYIEEDPEKDAGHLRDPLEAYERALLANTLKIRDLSAIDVMVPRADIVAIDQSIKPAELLEMLAEKQYSRVPVYKDTLDNAAGVLHMKDVLAQLAAGNQIDVQKTMRPISVIAPSMPVWELLLDMRRSRKHMALVIDEFGGIDGLITIGDILEKIVGEIADEHDHDDNPPQVLQNKDGSITVDARLPLSDFEENFGQMLTDEERAENDTIGGLAFFLAGRVPARGEILTHSSGMVFEVIEADPRRVSQLRVTKIPEKTSQCVS